MRSRGREDHGIHMVLMAVDCPTSNTEQIGDTDDFFLQSMHLPHVSPKEVATRTAINLTEALSDPHPKAPFGPIGSEKLAAIKQLAEIFKKHTKTKETVLTLRVEEKSMNKEETQPSLRVEETSLKMKPTMPVTRVGKPTNQNNGPHIILPDDDNKTPAYDPSASNEGDQMGPHSIEFNEPMH
eukprot:7326769-Ditylum_brightwellii.AAC.1